MKLCQCSNIYGPNCTWMVETDKYTDKQIDKTDTWTDGWIDRQTETYTQQTHIQMDV